MRRAPAALPLPGAPMLAGVDYVLFGSDPPVLRRPQFLAIVSSHTLATMLARKVEVPVDGFIVEGSTAGGHNAPPRGRMLLDDDGQPIYGDRDVPDLEVISGLGLPFWLAGGYTTSSQVAEALETGHVAWRCPDEPVEVYLRKGGDDEDTGDYCAPDVANALLPSD